MNKKRLVGVLLFSIAGLIVWFLFWGSMEKFSFPLNSDFIFGAFSVSIAASTSAYIFSPKIYTLINSSGKYSRAFGYGVLITLLSFFIGSFIFCLEFFENEYRDILSYILLSLFGFLYSVIMMSPGFVVGGLTGVLLLYLFNKFDPKTG